MLARRIEEFEFPKRPAEDKPQPRLPYVVINKDEKHALLSTGPQRGEAPLA